MEHDTTLVQRLGLLANQAECQNDDDFLEEFEQREGYRAYLITRGHPATMLGLAFRSGDFLAFSYAHLYRIDYSPSGQITLQFTDNTVTIEGIRIVELYRRLQVQRVLEVVEADTPSAELARPTIPIVSNIKVLPSKHVPTENAEK